MINFFRKIRKKMAANNRPLEYMKYAIGEIVLVVLGILIALQVNDLNESEKQKQGLINKLYKVEDELITNIKYFDFTLEYNLQQDSLLRVVINKQVDRKDYEENSYLINLITMYSNIDAYTNAYDSFISDQEAIPENLDSIKSLLDVIYQRDLKNVESGQAMVEDVCADFIEYLRDERLWYKDIKLGNISEEIYDFYLNDERYLNYAYFYYRMNGRNYIGSLQGSRISSVLAYQKLHAYLNQEDATRNEEELFTFKASDYQYYVGDYKDDKYYLSFKRENEELTVLITEENQNPVEIGITPISNTLFYLNNGFGYFHLILDDNKEVSSLVYGGEDPKFEVYQRVK